MEPVEAWLGGRNLQGRVGVTPRRRLEGEALAYALVSYIARPRATPPSVVVVLAEDFLSRIGPDLSVDH